MRRFLRGVVNDAKLVSQDLARQGLAHAMPCCMTLHIRTKTTFLMAAQVLRDTVNASGPRYVTLGRIVLGQHLLRNCCLVGLPHQVRQLVYPVQFQLQSRYHP